MTNAELISRVRSIAKHGADWRINWVLNRAADALEAADERIAELMPKEGEWIELDDPICYSKQCSVCGAAVRVCIGEMCTTAETYAKYCPNCGAKMRTVTNCHTLWRANDEQ